MKITVIHDKTQITIEEFVFSGQDKNTTIRWSDQNKNLQETITVICEEILKLNSKP